jgi:hypothetical protein
VHPHLRVDPEHAQVGLRSARAPGPTSVLPFISRRALRTPRPAVPPRSCSWGVPRSTSTSPWSTARAVSTRGRPDPVAPTSPRSSRP